MSNLRRHVFVGGLIVACLTIGVLLIGPGFSSSAPGMPADDAVASSLRGGAGCPGVRFTKCPQGKCDPTNYAIQGNQWYNLKVDATANVRCGGSEHSTGCGFYNGSSGCG